MSHFENTSDMMAALNASFGSTTTTTAQNDTPMYPSHPTHSRRKTQSEDLSILAHAQGQLQSHLAAAPIQSSDSTWHSHSQPPYPYPLQHPHQSQYPYPHQHQHQHHQTRPRSFHQFPTISHPDLRTPVTAPPFRWWENGVLVSTSESDDDDIRPSIERDADGSVVASIEMADAGGVSPRADVKIEEMDEDVDGEMRPRSWDEAQDWNGCVGHKESWVRRAGLKRVREEHERCGAAKRGRA